MILKKLRIGKTLGRKDNTAYTMNSKLNRRMKTKMALLYHPKII
jgi:hypothetical protein